MVDDGFWEVAKNKFEEVKKRYELVKEHKRWVSMRMKRGFCFDSSSLLLNFVFVKILLFSIILFGSI